MSSWIMWSTSVHSDTCTRSESCDRIRFEILGTEKLLTMPISARLREDIRTAVLAGKLPRRTAGSNQTILPLSGGPRGRFVVLARPSGLTAAGDFYYNLTGQQRPELASDPNQAPTTDSRGNSYILGRDNRKLLVRRLAPGGTHRLTALGKRFYSQTKTEYLTHVPVLTN